MATDAPRGARALLYSVYARGSRDKEAQGAADAMLARLDAAGPAVDEIIPEVRDALAADVARLRTQPMVSAQVRCMR